MEVVPLRAVCAVEVCGHRFCCGCLRDHAVVHIREQTWPIRWVNLLCGSSHLRVAHRAGSRGLEALEVLVSWMSSAPGLHMLNVQLEQTLQPVKSPNKMRKPAVIIQGQTPGACLVTLLLQVPRAPVH